LNIDEAIKARLWTMNQIFTLIAVSIKLKNHEDGEGDILDYPPARRTIKTIESHPPKGILLI
jgi:hypothetical protein